MTNNDIAGHMIHHLMNNTPFYLSSRLAEIFWNFNDGSNEAVLASMKMVFGSRDMHLYYEAAQSAHDMAAAC
jgi:hypothetical protein